MTIVLPSPRRSVALSRFSRPQMCLLALLSVLALALPLLPSPRHVSAPLVPVQPGERPRLPALSDMPLALQYTISATIGRDDPAYAITAGPGATYAIINPRNGLTGEVAGTTLTVHSGSYEWRVSLEGWGRTTTIAPVSELNTVWPTANRLEQRAGDLTVWYQNGPLGLQQGWTLGRQPAGTGPVVLRLGQGGDLRAGVVSSGRDLELRNASGALALRYAGLLAYDATGRELPAGFATGPEGHMSILVDDTGAAYPLTIDPWVKKAKLTASDGVGASYFGASVVVSGDGSTVVVGVPGSIVEGVRAGAAYVFVKPSIGWSSVTRTAKLTASDGAKDDSVGGSVAVSSDGQTVVVGAALHSAGKIQCGAAYVFVKAGTAWTDATETAKLRASDAQDDDLLGISVGVSGDGNTIVAGAVRDSNIVSGGAVYVFIKPINDWNDTFEDIKLSPPDARYSNYFGSSVAVNIDGSTIVVGAPGNSLSGVNPGAVYVFVRPGNIWTASFSTAKLIALDGKTNAFLGISVAVSSDGATVVAGAPGDAVTRPRGFTYVFVKAIGGWTNSTESAKLTASEGVSGDLFGSSVAISGDGNTVIAGAPYDLGGYPTLGAINIYIKPVSGWASSDESIRIAAIDKLGYDDIGRSAAISSDSSTVIIGAATPSNFGAAYILAKPIIAVTSEGKLSGAPSPGTFVIHSDCIPDTDLPVSFTLSGTLTPNTDYLVTGARFSGTTGSAVIPAGTDSVSVTVTLTNNSVPTGHTVDLTLAATAEYVLGAPAQASLTVLPVVTSIASGAPSRFGPIPGTLTLVRSGDLSAPLTAGISLGGTAAYGRDYTLTSQQTYSIDSSGVGTVTFPAGVDSVNLSVTPAASSQSGQSIGLTIRDGPDYVPGTPISASLTIDGAPPPPWLVLLYLAGDDIAPGEGDSLTKFLDPMLPRLPYNPSIRLVVLYDGNVEGDAAIYVRDPDKLRNITAEVREANRRPGFLSADTKEFDTGSVATLQNFINWARLTYPGSPHTMLSIIDHGGGWAPEPDDAPQRRAAHVGQTGGLRGMSIDRLSGDSLSTRDTGSVLDDLGGLGRFDVIFFDACLMGMVESAYEVAPYTHYLVAGENLLWSDFPYERYFDPVRFTAATSPEDLAGIIVDQYNEPIKRDEHEVATEPFAIAAIDTSKLTSLILKTRQMATDLLSLLPAAESPIRTAYAQAQKFDYDGNFALDRTDGYVDLAHLARLLAAQQISATLSIDAQNVAEAVTTQVVVKQKAVTGTYQGEAQWDFTNANGLSIYMPLGERDCRPTGRQRQEGDPAAKPPCTAPKAAIGEPIIEPQLSYYARPQQLHFTADVPEWAALLAQLDKTTPARIRGDYHMPMPAAPPTRIYLPVVMNRFVDLTTAPDLTITAVEVRPERPAVGQPAEVRVTIANRGAGAVVGPFWVDLYIDPLWPPEVNTLWSQVSATGASWRVYGLAAGETRVLSTLAPNDPQNPGRNYSNFSAFVASGPRQVYALVDSFAAGSPEGAVVEQDEANNRFGPLTVNVLSASTAATSTIQQLNIDQR